MLNFFFFHLFQAPEGENQPSTEVDLFISTEKIMVLNTDLKVSCDRLDHTCIRSSSFDAAMKRRNRIYVSYDPFLDKSINFSITYSL